MLMEASKRGLKIFTPITAVIAPLALLGPTYCYQSFDVSPADVGMSAQSLGLRAVAVLLVIAILFLSCAAICALPLMSDKIVARFAPTHGIRPSRRKRYARLALFAVSMEIYSALIAFSLVFYEQSTRTAATFDGDTRASLLFRIAFWATAGFGAAALATALVHIVWPRTTGPWVRTLKRVRRRFRRHPIGMTMIGSVAVAVLVAVGAVVIASAVTVQLRQGRTPGLIGRFIGVSAGCYQLINPTKGQPTGPVLRLGENDGHTVVLANGHTERLPPAISVRGVSATQCWVRNADTAPNLH